MSSADVKPKKLKKSKGAFGKDGTDPRASTSDAAPAAAADESAPKKEKKDKKRKAEADTPVAESSTASTPVDEDAARKEKKALKKAAKAAKAAASASAAPTGLPTPADTPATTPGPTVLSVESLAYLAENKITVSAPYTPLLDLSKLPISPKLVPALSEYTKPTPIQACSWPALFAGKDVVGVAETGSGKTMGFGVSPQLARASAALTTLCGPSADSFVSRLVLSDSCDAAPSFSSPVVGPLLSAFSVDPDCVADARARASDVCDDGDPLRPARLQVGLSVRRNAQARAGRSPQAGRPQGRGRNAWTSA